MNDPNRLLDDLRIATPCTADWNLMTGTDTMRFCGECNRNVYNISGMRAAEAARLVAGAEGRLCVRMYQRSDGTVLTADCPVGVRAALRRATRAAGAALTAALGLFTAVSGRVAFAGPQDAQAAPQCTAQPETGGAESRPPILKMGKIAGPVRRGETVFVTVHDARGIRLIGAEVVLTDPETGAVVIAIQEAPGRYRFDGIEPGVYTVSVTASGFVNPLPRALRVRKGKQSSVTFELDGGEPRPVLGEVVVPHTPQ